jgi:predicted DNA-binding protein
MTPQAPKPRRIGRPPAGARDGEKVKDYPQLSIRLPAEVRAKLQALSVIESRPQWRVITEAIDCYAKGRSDAERRLIAELAGRSGARARGARRPGR